MNKKYVIALVMTSVFFIATQFYIQNKIYKIKSDNTFTEVLGRQTTLINKIESLCKNIITLENTEEEKNVLIEIKKASDFFNISNNVFTKDNASLSFKIVNSEEYDKKLKSFENSFAILYKNISEINKLSFESQSDKVSLDEYIEEIKKEKQNFEFASSELMDQFLIERDQEIKKLQILEMVVLGITFITLMLEWGIVFKEDTIPKKTVNAQEVL